MIPSIINTRKVVTPGSITRVIFAAKKQITKIIKVNEIIPKYFFMIPHPFLQSILPKYSKYVFFI